MGTAHMPGTLRCNRGLHLQYLVIQLPKEKEDIAGAGDDTKRWSRNLVGRHKVSHNWRPRRNWMNRGGGRA